MDFAATLVSDQLALKPAVEIPTLCVAGSAVSWHGIADAQNLDIFYQRSSCVFLSGDTWYYFSGGSPLDRQSSSVADSFFFFSSSDHSSMQLLHLHSLYPAGLGEAGR